MYRGGSIGYLHEISDARIFVLPSPLSIVEMVASIYCWLLANRTLMHRIRPSESRSEISDCGWLITEE
jgi:hypothetical protein